MSDIDSSEILNEEVLRERTHFLDQMYSANTVTEGFEWVGSMYGADDEEDEDEDDGEDKPLFPAMKGTVLGATDDTMRLLGREVELTIDGKSVRVATNAYVRAIEQTIDEQGRLIRRLVAEMKQVRVLVNRQAHMISDLEREMDSKVSYGQGQRK